MTDGHLRGAPEAAGCPPRGGLQPQAPAVLPGLCRRRGAAAAAAAGSAGLRRQAAPHQERKLDPSASANLPGPGPGAGLWLRVPWASTSPARPRALVGGWRQTKLLAFSAGRSRVQHPRASRVEVKGLLGPQSAHPRRTPLCPEEPRAPSRGPVPGGKPRSLVVPGLMHALCGRTNTPLWGGLWRVKGAPKGARRHRRLRRPPALRRPIL